MNCLVCKKKITGRSDKRFCSKKCSNDFYNAQNRDIKNFMWRVNHALRRNYRILAKIKKSESVAILKQKGFNFEYFTGIEGKWTLCYDYAYQVKGEVCEVRRAEGV